MIDDRTVEEKVLFARGVLEILRGTGLFNFLIEQAIRDLDNTASEVRSLSKANI